MPCFKGLAVSIHTPDGPLPEHSIQRHTRLSRITSYIPVPPPKISPTSQQPEQSTFAVSITLLTPGLSVPYSTPKPTPQDPYPKPQLVGGVPGLSNLSALRDRAGSNTASGSRFTTVYPYEALTTSPNETVAAYIYFDGRQKEEVATLLRRGEETWVNSRWVGVPESEGGGLAEREFLFREVGLERWLNGLDLKGEDAAAVVEKRRQRMEKQRRRRRNAPRVNLRPGSTDPRLGPMESDDEIDADTPFRHSRARRKQSVLRYGDDATAPLERLSDEDDGMSTDSDHLGLASESDSDDDPIPESAGQIKVALFRVLASGEIKKGEYSPQFDAHDDDEEGAGRSQASGAALDNGEGSSKSKPEQDTSANVDHTTSFAKPKTLDPKSISTQTVTGIDGPDKPYAVFTFLYRGEKQLSKMGILKPRKAATGQPATATTHAKRRSLQTDLANLKPLQAGGTLGFTGVRDRARRRSAHSAPHDPDDMDSDDDDDDDDDEGRSTFLRSGRPVSSPAGRLGTFGNLSRSNSSHHRRRGSRAEGHDDADDEAGDPARGNDRRKSGISNAGSRGGKGARLPNDADDDLDEVNGKAAQPLSPDDLRKQGELAEGVKKIKLKRQHSFDPPPGSSASSSAATLINPESQSSSGASSSTRSKTNPPGIYGHSYSKSLDVAPQLLSNAVFDPATSTLTATSSNNGLKPQDTGSASARARSYAGPSVQLPASSFGQSMPGDQNAALASLSGLPYPPPSAESPRMKNDTASNLAIPDALSGKLTAFGPASGNASAIHSSSHLAPPDSGDGSGIVGSPLKKQRHSTNSSTLHSGLDGSHLSSADIARHRASASALAQGLGFGFGASSQAETGGSGFGNPLQSGSDTFGPPIKVESTNFGPAIKNEPSASSHTISVESGPGPTIKSEPSGTSSNAFSGSLQPTWTNGNAAATSKDNSMSDAASTGNNAMRESSAASGSRSFKMEDEEL